MAIVIRQGYKKDYDKRTGTINCTMATTMAHIIAHIENAKEFFDIKSKSIWPNPMGFEWDKRFPNYVSKIVREIDMKYGLAQDISYRHIEIVEPDWSDEDHWSGEWPVWDRDYGSIFDNPRITVERLANEERQIQSWINNFNWMLHDAMISYIYAIGYGQGEYDSGRDRIGGNIDYLRSVAVDFANWKAEFRVYQEQYRQKLVRRMEIESNE